MIVREEFMYDKDKERKKKPQAPPSNPISFLKKKAVARYAGGFRNAFSTRRPRWDCITIASLRRNHFRPLLTLGPFFPSPLSFLRFFSPLNQYIHSKK